MDLRTSQLRNDRDHGDPLNGDVGLALRRSNYVWLGRANCRHERLTRLIARLAPTHVGAILALLWCWVKSR